MDKNYEVGQCWSFETMPGYENARIIIGAIERIEGIGEIVCLTLANVPLPKQDGSGLEAGVIPFVPFAREAVDESVLKLEGQAKLPPHFEQLLESWKNEEEEDEFLPVPVHMFLEMLASGANG